MQAKLSFFVLKFVVLICVVSLGFFSFVKCKNSKVFGLIAWWFFTKHDFIFQFFTTFTSIVLNIAATCREPRISVTVKIQCLYLMASNCLKKQRPVHNVNSTEFSSSFNVVRVWFDLLQGVVFHISFSKGITCI